ncbi:unnamed protein product, partial [marine sediment metagenome]
ARIFHWPLYIGRTVSLSARSPKLAQDAFTFKEAQYQNYIVNLEEQLLEKQRQIEKLPGFFSALTISP